MVFSSSFNSFEDVYEIYTALSILCVSVAALPDSKTKLEIQLLLHGAVIHQAAVMT